MSEIEFNLPRSALDDDKILRRDKLDQYFPCGLIPFEQTDGNRWKVTAFCPRESDYYVDPCLEQTLQNWRDPITIETLGGYHRFHSNAFVSLYDSWSLYYWSLVLEWLKTTNQVPSRITLLHVDDYSALGSPHIACEEDNDTCLFTNKPISFSNPDTIKEAIFNKSIGILSYITPLLHAFSSVDILHLCYSYDGLPTEKGVNCNYSEDSLLATWKKRPSIEIMSSKGTHCYWIANTLEPLLTKVKSDSVLLFHISGSAFSNRYGMDSNWTNKRPTIDLPLEQITHHIDQLFDRVSQLSLPIFFNLTLSPGFFPSEFWGEMYDYVLSEGQRHQIINSDPFSEYLTGYFPLELYEEN